MHDITRDFLVSLMAFATIFGIIYVIVITRYRERMAMLEKGVDPTFFTSKDAGGSRTLKFGMLSVGIALGLVMGSVLYKNQLFDRPTAYFAMIFLFGGLSLIFNFLIDRRLRG